MAGQAGLLKVMHYLTTNPKSKLLLYCRYTAESLSVRVTGGQVRVSGETRGDWGEGNTTSSSTQGFSTSFRFI